MADVSSREKTLYWILIALIVVGGGAAFAYFFVSGRQTGTSLTDVAGTNTGSSGVQTFSLIDIVSNDGTSESSNGTNMTNQVPQPANNNGTSATGPVLSNQANNGTNMTNQVPQAANNRTNQVPQAANNSQNSAEDQVLPTDRPVVTNAGTAVSTATSATLSTGSALPGESPTTGAGVLLISGAASLGISGVASALILRRPRKRGTTARR